MDAYICSEFCAWNSDYLVDSSFEEWLAAMRSRFGEIREIEADTKYVHDANFPEVFHESFSQCKKQLSELSKRVEAMGYSAKDIFKVGRDFITVSKDDKIFLMNKHDLSLLIPEPVSFYFTLKCAYFEIITGGKTLLFTIDGQKLYEADRGHFLWRLVPNKKRSPWHTFHVFNEETGQELFISPSTEPVDGNPNVLHLFYHYYDKNHNELIPKVHL